MGVISDMLAGIPGVKQDWKNDFKEDAKADWKLDWDAAPGDAPAVVPTVIVFPAISGSPIVGQTLSVSSGTWAGNPAPTISYQWTVDGNDITGATSNTYVVDPADATFMIGCRVLAVNVAGANTVLLSEIGPVTV